MNLAGVASWACDSESVPAMQHLDPPRRFLHRRARCAALLLSVSALVVIIGWIFDEPWLRGGFSPGGITVKANAGIALLCCGLSLGIQCFRVPRPLVRMAQALALLALSIGTLTFSQHLFGWELGI